MQENDQCQQGVAGTNSGLAAKLQFAPLPRRRRRRQGSVVHQPRQASALSEVPAFSCLVPSESSARQRLIDGGRRRAPSRQRNSIVSVIGRQVRAANPVEFARLTCTKAAAQRSHTATGQDRKRAAFAWNRLPLSPSSSRSRPSLKRRLASGPVKRRLAVCCGVSWKPDGRRPWLQLPFARGRRDRAVQDPDVRRICASSRSARAKR